MQKEYISAPTTHSAIRPCIAELLRTGHHPPELILRVERVVEVPIILTPAEPEIVTTPTRPSCSLLTPGTEETEQVPTRRTYRLLLTDGEFVIQALLVRELHYFVSIGEVVPGVLLNLERFEVRKAKKISYKPSYGIKKEEDLDQVTFLAVERFVTVPNDSDKQLSGTIEHGLPIIKTRTMDKKRASDHLDDLDDFDDLDDLIDLNDLNKLDAEGPPSKRHRSSMSSFGVDSDTIEDTLLQSDEQIEDLLRSDDNFDIYEDRHTSPSASREKKALRSPQKRIGLKPRLDAKHPAPLSPATSPATNIPHFQQSCPTLAKSPRKRFNPRTVFSQTTPNIRPLNLLTIHALFHPLRPLPKRNYILDVFGIVSWISPTTVTRRNMPPKRDLRIVDPTFKTHPYRSQQPHNVKLELGASVSVFVDAERFCPPVGTVALMRSLKTHEWEGVSLNAYEKECGGGKEWFISDRRKLEGLGYDVTGLKQWWEKWNAERERERKVEEERSRKVEAGTVRGQ